MSKNPSNENLTRDIQPMPEFVRHAIKSRGLVDKYEARPAYQRNDYLMWINQAKHEGTKRERLIAGPQGARITIRTGDTTREMLNLCANNYLGLANNPEIRAAARNAIDEHGFGMSSVRFICGTQTLHRQLEQAVAHYLGKDDAILFAAAFDANGGLFEPLLTAEDAIISDALNHASIIDGVRLSKAKRFRY